MKKLIMPALIGAMISGQACAMSEVDSVLQNANSKIMLDESKEVLQNLNLNIIVTNNGTILADRQKNVIIQGDVSVIKDGKITNLMSEVNQKIISGIPEPIHAQAPNERVKIAMFTDISCGWCQKVHHDLDAYLKRGISFDFYLFPREGLESRTAAVMSHVMGLPQEERLAKLQSLFNGGQFQQDEVVRDIVKQHFQSGAMVGVRGTPSLFVNGHLIDGYLPPDELLQRALLYTE